MPQTGTWPLKEFVDVETAKQAGRIGFGEMLMFPRKDKTCRILLVEKTDRLYRNLKDWVTLDELDLEIHVVKENLIISQDSRSSEKFTHGIKVLMAKNYIDNPSEERRRGCWIGEGTPRDLAVFRSARLPERLGPGRKADDCTEPRWRPSSDVYSNATRPASTPQRKCVPGRHAISQEQAPRSGLHHPQDFPQSALLRRL
jgi:hypothetical protein